MARAVEIRKELTNMEAGAMRRKDVKRIIAYYFGIPAMRAELAVERAELEDEYDGLRGTSYEIGRASCRERV